MHREPSREAHVTTIRLSDPYVAEYNEIVAMHPDVRLRQIVERAIHDTWERMVLPHRAEGKITLVFHPKR